jgi:hypothetical protein
MAPPGAETSTNGLDLGMMQRAGEAQLGLAGQHHLQHFFRVSRAHGDEGLGVRGLEAFEDIGQQIGADRQRGGDGDGPARGRPQVVNGLAGQGQRVEQLLGVRAQGAAGRRQRQPGAPPLEQRHAQRVFQGLDARADGRLTDPQRVGGPAKAAEGANGEKGFDLGDLH